MPEPNTGRIAIKLGAPSGKSSKNPGRFGPSSTLGKRPRSTTAFGDASDSEPDNDDDRWGKHQVISGFGADGVEIEQKKREAARKDAKRDYVIASLPNRDWRNEAKAQRSTRNGLPAEARQGGAGETTEHDAGDKTDDSKWGLNVKVKKIQAVGEEEEEEEMNGSAKEQEPQTNQQELEPVPQTADEEAMDSLLGKTSTKKVHVIQQNPITEDEAYKRDADAAGAMPTMEDYEAMPVEEFGAALLRGMGWDGSQRGPKVKEVKRRQNRLGLGAKELKDAEDLGGWNQGGGKKSSRPPRLADYRRQEEKKKDSRGREDSYKKERERERARERDGHNNYNDRERDRDRDRHTDRDRDRDRHRDRDRNDGRHRDRDRHHHSRDDRR